MIGDLAAARLQQFDELERGAFADIRHIFLVGDADDQEMRLVAGSARRRRLFHDGG
jgi:hypothetical protein